MKSYKIDDSRVALTNLMLEVTSSCNFDCIHCYCPRRHPESSDLSFDEICRLIDYISHNGVKQLTITGGEPFLRQDLNDIITNAVEKGLQVTVFSNGFLISDAIAKNMQSLNVNFQISLHGSSAAIHDSICQTNGAFDKAIGAIQLLITNGVPVSIMTTLMKENIHDMVNISQLCFSLGVTQWQAAEFIPVEKARHFQSIDQHVLYEAFRLVGGPSPALCDSTACGVGFIKIAVLSNGDIVPCEVTRIKIGNIRQNDLLTVFFNSELLNEYRHSTVEFINECTACNMKESCRGGCKASVFARKGTLFASNPGSCAIYNQFR